MAVTKPGSGSRDGAGLDKASNAREEGYGAQPNPAQTPRDRASAVPAEHPRHDLAGLCHSLRTCLDSIEDRVFTVDSQYRYTSFNAAHAAVMKTLHGAEIAPGGNLLDNHSNAGERTAARRNLDRALAGDSFSLRVQARAGSASPHAFEVTYRPLRGPDGEITGVAVHARDITDQLDVEQALAEARAELEARVEQRTAELQEAKVKVEAERKRFHDALDMLPAYLVLLSPDFRVPFANRYFEERFGASRGRRCFEYLFGRSEPCEDCQSYRPMQTGTTHRWEWTGPDGRTYDIHDFPFTDTDGSSLVMEVGLDVTEQKRAAAELEEHRAHLEEAVRERTDELLHANRELASTSDRLTSVNELLDTITSGTEVIVAALDTDFRYTFFNRAYRDEIKRLTNKEIEIGSSMHQAFDTMPEQREVALEQWQRAMRGESTTYRIEFGDPSRYRRVYNVRHTPIFDARQAVIGVGEVAFDVTDQARAESALQESGVTLRGILDATNESVWLFSEDGTILLGNETAVRRLGRPVHETIGKHFAEVLPASLAASRLARLREVIETGKSVQFEDERQGIGFHHTFYPVADATGRITRVACFSRDVTQTRQAERDLFAALREKEVLLREIHHRVKNNLQIIASMLNLQLGTISNEADRQPFIESQNRVRTLALIHEKLYGSNDFSSIPFRSYIADLSAFVSRSATRADTVVSLDLAVDDVRFPVGTAIPLALILNELLSNAYKHAFVPGREGHLTVSLRRLGDDTFELAVEDDGVGLPGDLDPEKVESMGLQLVSILTQQLGGTLEIRRSPGTRFAITFTTSA